MTSPNVCGRKRRGNDPGFRIDKLRIIINYCGQVDVIRKFDPWNDPLCTCPGKYGFNPYTGCAHRCVYCYVTSYVPHAFECREKKNLLQRVEKDLRRVDRRLAISMSNSSDPYPPMEAELRLTRGCLEIFRRENVRVQVITKSDLVARDAGILAEMPVVVSFTVTTLDENLARKLESRAPLPSKRLRAMRILSKAGVPVTLRLDPIFPGLNDGEIERIIEVAADAGAQHVTSSTFKPRPDGWRRFSRVFPETARKLAPLYFEKGKRHHNSWYLPRDLRISLMRRVRESCDHAGVSFASCREGLSELTSAPTCDGTHLMSTH